MDKISACIVIKNEGHLLERCLKSLDGCVDEIILVHDGECSDDSLEIGEKYKAKIFVRESHNNCNPHRPFSFSKATNEWILQIDADEFLSKSLQKEIKKLAQNKEVDAYEFLWPVWEKDKYVTKEWPHKLCFFRKDKVFFLGIPNGLVYVYSNKQKNMNLVLEHRPLSPNFSFKTFFKKLIPKAKIQAEYYLKDFKDIKKFNCNLKDWDSRTRLRRKFPLFLMPFEFLTVFFRIVLTGGWKDGFVGVRVALIFGIYRVLVNYYIFTNKIKR